MGAVTIEEYDRPSSGYASCSIAKVQQPFGVASVRVRVHRAHRKSRDGCTTCKLRRVKCDERRPLCRVCERRGTKCSYDDADVEAAAVAPKSIVRSHGRAGPLKIPCDSLGTPRTSASHRLYREVLGDARLMRGPDEGDPARAMLLVEYFQRASTSLIPGLRKEMRSNVYFNIIPTLAVHHEGVSHAIFALSTLSLAVAEICKASLEKTALPVARPGAGAVDVVVWHHLHQAHSFYDKCMVTLKAYIANLSGENADAALACSLLLIPYELAHSRLDRHHDGSSRSKWSRPLTSHDSVINLNWMKFIRGLGSLMPIIQSRWPKRETPIYSFFQWIRQGDLLSPGAASCASSSFDNAIVSDHCLAPVIFAERPAAQAKLRRVMQAIHPENSADDNTSAVHRKDPMVCIEALDQLELVLQRFALCAEGRLRQPVFRVLFHWVVQIRNPFFELLLDEHILALAVYCHFLVYLIMFEKLWWIGDMGRATLRNILNATQSHNGAFALADFSPCQLQELFQWPCRIVRSPEIGDQG